LATTPNRGYDLVPTGAAPDVPYWFNRLANILDTDIQSVMTGWSKDPNFTALAAAALAAAGKPRQLTAGDVDNLADGFYFWRTPTEMAAMTGTMPRRPDGQLMPGLLWQYTTAYSLKFQIYIGYGQAGDVQYRSTGSVNAGNLIPWRRLYTAPPVIDPALVSPYRRPFLVDAFKRRRGAGVGTAGKPVVALRFDHGWNNFRSVILPLLEKYDLPWLQATNSRQNTTASNVSQNTEVTLADVQALALVHGGEIANHGATHKDAVTEEALLDEIVTGLAELKAAMPLLAIEHWCPPGIGAGGYMGYSNMSTLEHHLTAAGLLVQSHHAAVSGYVPGAYRALPAGLDVGLGHYTMDAATPAGVSSRVDLLSSMDTPMGMVLMLHPSLVGSPGYITAAQVETVLADLARRRDAGTLEILTPGGLLLADHRTDHRHNLLSNSDLSAGAKFWAVGESWKTVPGGGVRSAGSGVLAQTVAMANFPHFAGGVREAVVKVSSADVGGALQLTVRTGDQVITKTYRDINAADGPRVLRNQFVIPAGAASFTVELASAAAPELTVTSVRCQTV